MYKNNHLNNQKTEEDAKKHRTYNFNSFQKECPVVVNYLKSKEKCQHTETVKKYLFNSHYFECVSCKEEV